MLRTAVYIRRSTDDHDDKQIFSLERQWADLEHFIETENGKRSKERQLLIVDPVNDIFREEGSAKKINRPGFNELIRRIERGRYDVILATEPSRLSRNPMDTGRLIHILDQEELQSIITIKGEFTTSYLDKFTLGLLLSISKYENDLRGANTKSGMALRKSHGATTHAAPMGYRNAGVIKGEKYIEKDGENFDKLQKLWKLFLTGKYTIVEIAEMGEETGVTRVNGHGTQRERRAIPTESAYRAMFRNRYYAGRVESNAEWIIGRHPPMVTDEEFDEVQQILQKSGYKHSVIKPSYDNLLKGLLLCGHTNEPAYLDVKERYTCPKCKERSSKKDLERCSKCGYPVSRETWKVETRRYYSFAKGLPHTYLHERKLKTAKNIPAEVIESLIEAELAKISISDGMFEIMKKLLYTEWSKRNKDLRRKRSEIEKETAEIDDKRENVLEELYAAWTTDKKKRSDLSALIEKYETQIADKRKELADLVEKMEEEFEKAWEILNNLLEAKNIFGDSSESFEPKRRLLLSMVSNQKFLDGKIITEWKKPFDLLATAGLTKQKSQNESEISDWNVEWLPGADSNRRPIG